MHSKQGPGLRTVVLHVTPFSKTTEDAVYCAATATDLITNILPSIAISHFPRINSAQILMIA